MVSVASTTVTTTTSIDAALMADPPEISQRGAQLLLALLIIFGLLLFLVLLMCKVMTKEGLGNCVSSLWARIKGSPMSSKESSSQPSQGENGSARSDHSEKIVISLKGCDQTDIEGLKTLNNLKLLHRKATKAKILGLMNGPKKIAFWILVFRLALNLLFASQIIWDLHTYADVQDNYAGLVYNKCRKIQKKEKEECLASTQAAKDEVERLSKDKDLAIEADIRSMKVSEAILVIFTFAISAIETARACLGLSTAVTTLRNLQQGTADNLRNSNNSIPTQGSNSNNEKQKKLSDAFFTISRQLLFGRTLREAAGMSSLRFLWMINVSSASLWWKSQIAHLFMGLSGANKKQGAVRVLLGLISVCVALTCFYTGVYALRLKIYEVQKVIAKPDEPWDFWSIMRFFTFINSMCSIIDLQKVQNDRMDLFYFGGIDGKITRHEDAERQLYKALLVRDILKAFTNEQVKEAMRQKKSVKRKDWFCRETEIPLLSQLRDFQAFQLIITFDSYDLQRRVLDDREEVIYEFYRDFAHLPNTEGDSLTYSDTAVHVVLQGSPDRLEVIQFLKENNPVKTPAKVSDSSWDSVIIKTANGDEETVLKNRVERIDWIWSSDTEGNVTAEWKAFADKVLDKVFRVGGIAEWKAFAEKFGLLKGSDEATQNKGLDVLLQYFAWGHEKGYDIQRTDVITDKTSDLMGSWTEFVDDPKQRKNLPVLHENKDVSDEILLEQTSDQARMLRQIRSEQATLRQMCFDAMDPFFKDDQESPKKEIWIEEMFAKIGFFICPGTKKENEPDEEAPKEDTSPLSTRR